MVLLLVILGPMANLRLLPALAVVIPERKNQLFMPFYNDLTRNMLIRSAVLNIKLYYSFG